MARFKLVRRTLEFQGRQSAGPCECPACHSQGEVKPYKKGEQWATFLCPTCGWYQVPTMNAHPLTRFQVVVNLYEEIIPRGRK